MRVHIVRKKLVGLLLALLLAASWSGCAAAFSPTVIASCRRRHHQHENDTSSCAIIWCRGSSSSSADDTTTTTTEGKNNVSSTATNNNQKKKDNKAMQFLKKIGKVGGASNRDFRYAIGVDEGPAGKSAGIGMGLKKSQEAFKSCVETAVVDDLSEPFPQTSSGTRWSGFTDQVMGGISMANLAREQFDGRTANVLRGKVSMANNGGFIQMATNLAPASGELSRATVDASRFEGVELDVQNFSSNDAEGSETFNVHLKNKACLRPFSSYRASFEAPNKQWKTVRIPFCAFEGKGPGAEDVPFDPSQLIRLGIVAIGKAMKVQLAVSGVRFYK